MPVADAPENELDPLVDHVVTLVTDASSATLESDRRPAVVAAVHGALLSNRTSARENVVIQSIAKGGIEAEFDRLLTERVRNAFFAGAEAAGGATIDAAPRVMPRIVVARGDGLELDEDGTPTMTAGDESPETYPLLKSMATVYAGEGSIVERVRNQGGVHLITNSGGEKELLQTLSLEAENGATNLGVNVMELTDALQGLERHMVDIAPAPERPKLEEAARGGDIVGKVLDEQYRIDRRVGRGGFGTVYKARDIGLGRDVGVKVLNPKIARNQSSIDALQAEAQRLATMDHENIVRVYGAKRCRHSGVFFIAMEFLAGSEVNDVLADEGTFGQERTGAILHDVLSALEYAHDPSQGGGSLLHLDLKPQNVFLVGAAERGAETAKVIDFGIGQHMGQEEVDLTLVNPLLAGSDEHLEASIMARGTDQAVEMTHAELRAGSGSGSGRSGKRSSSRSKSKSKSKSRSKSKSSTGRPSVAGTVVRRAKGGTVLYASPEQCRHLRGDSEIPVLDGRSDLYSLGVFGFKMLTGQMPFEKRPETFEQGFLQHMEEPPRKVRSVRPSINRRFADVIDRCLEKDPDRRWESATEAREQLERAMRPLVSKGAALAIAAAVLLLSGMWIYVTYFVERTSDLVPVEVSRVAEMGVSSVVDNSRVSLSTDPDAGETSLSFAKDTIERESYDVSSRPAIYKGTYAPKGEPDLATGVALVPGAEGSYVFTLDKDVQPFGHRDVHVRWGDASHSRPFKLGVFQPIENLANRMRVEVGSSGSSDDSPMGLKPGERTVLAVQASGLVVQVSDMWSDGRWDTVEFIPSKDGAEPLPLSGEAKTGKFRIDLSRLTSGVSESGLFEFKLKCTEGTGLQYTVEQPYAIDLLASSPKLVASKLYWSDNSGTPKRSRWISDGKVTGCRVPEGATGLNLTGSVQPAMSLAGAFSVSASLRVDDEVLASIQQPVAVAERSGQFDINLRLDDRLADLLDSGPTGLAGGASATLKLTLTSNPSRILGNESLSFTPKEYQLALVPDKSDVQFSTSSPDGSRLELEDGADLWTKDALVEFGIQREESGGSDLLVHDPKNGPRFLSTAVLSLELAADEHLDISVYDVEPDILAEIGGEAGSKQAAEKLFGDEEQLKRVTRVVGFSVHRQVEAGTIVARWIGDPIQLRTEARVAINWPVIELQTPANSAPVKTVKVEVQKDGKLFGETDPQPGPLSEAGTLSFEAARWAPDEDDQEWEDGRYLVRLTVTDAAGFEVLLDPLEFHVDAVNPRVQIEDWNAENWESATGLDEGTRLVRVSAVDGNGIGSVTGTVTGASDRTLEEELRFVQVEGADYWQAAVNFTPDWAFQPITVEVVAHEELPEGVNRPRGQGTDKRNSKIARVEQAFPEKTIGPRPQRSSTEMRLVRSPSALDKEDPYHFAVPLEDFSIYQSGRDPKANREAKDKRDDFDRRNGWPVRAESPVSVRKVDMQPFYLDESEVSVAEFAVFLGAPDGYAADEWWPTGGWRARESKEARRKTLLDVVKSANPNRPMASVNWEEAYAYAAWAGKRLPTVLEWELAVRGGKERLHALQDKPNAPPPVADGTTPRLVRDERYRSSNGFYHLSGNVSEWTQTATWMEMGRYMGEDPEAFLGKLIRGQDFEHLEEEWSFQSILNVPEDLSFLVVGGSVNPSGRSSHSPYFDYRMVRPARPGMRNKSMCIGFRCAMDAK